MNIKIIVVNENYFHGELVECWMRCQLPSGKCVEIYDYSRYNLKQYEGMTVNCLVTLYEFNIFLNKESNDLDVLWGKYTTEFDFSADFPELYGKLKRRDGLITEEGTFFISGDKYERIGVRNGDQVGVKVGGYDLFAWRQVV